MSDNDTTSVEVAGTGPSLGIDTEGGKPQKAPEGSAIELDIGAAPEEGELDEATEAQIDEPRREEDEALDEEPPKEEPEDEGDEEPAKPTDLPPFKADDEKVVKAYDEAYAPGGELNVSRLSEEFWSNADPKAALAGTLKEDTYAFLEKRFGLKKSDVKDIEVGLVLKHAGDTEKVLAVAGGAEGFNAALAWAKSGGYSKEQLARFEKLSSSKDLADRQEAVELLAQRYKSANPAPAEDRRALRPDRKAQTEGETPVRVRSGPKPYESKAAWEADLDAAVRSNDPEQYRAVRSRLVVSPWYQKQAKAQRQKPTER